MLSTKQIGDIANGMKSLISAKKLQSVKPEKEKLLTRLFSVEDTSKIIGINKQQLVELAESGVVPDAQKTSTNRRKGWCLKNVNIIRDYLDVRRKKEGLIVPYYNPYRSNGDPVSITTYAIFKGGATKTTTSVHNAVYKAIYGYRTLLVDLDPQGSLTSYFYVNPDKDVNLTFYHYILASLDMCKKEQVPELFDGNEVTLKNCIKPTFWPRLDILPSNLMLSEAERLLPRVQAQHPEFASWEILSDALSSVSDQYDCIVIDTAPQLGSISTNAIWASNGIICPIPPNMIDLSSARYFFELLHNTLASIEQDEGIEKNFNFLKILIAKAQDRKIQKLIELWLRRILDGYVLDNKMIDTTIIPATGADMSTAYETNSTSMATLRCMDSLNNVNQEIEILIRAGWQHKNIRDKILADGEYA